MKLTNRTFVLTAMLAASISLFYACSKSATGTVAPVSRVSAISSSNLDLDPTTMCGIALEAPLTAGQTIPAGSISIQNDPNNVYVTYNTSGDWKLSEVHLSIDCNTNGDCTQAKSSDLAPGKFPYKMVFNAGTAGPCDPSTGLPTSYTFVISRAELGTCTCFCVYPHAVVVRCDGSSIAETQTAWGGNVMQITNGKWYGGTNYCLQECGDLGK